MAGKRGKQVGSKNKKVPKERNKNLTNLNANKNKEKNDGSGTLHNSTFKV